ncbi:hypothetical protein NPIL_492301 [Nephila pilipes]|uniref:Uncharacterized protein n=1 Tax=Nephila pilipes TaxID=299642 RepID=A0A8X6N732_NEPPI|nr:hypothetical protein NPIL_492301 [Nephila pilipes]
MLQFKVCRSRGAVFSVDGSISLGDMAGLFIVLSQLERKHRCSRTGNQFGGLGEPNIAHCEPCRNNMWIYWRVIDRGFEFSGRWVGGLFLDFKHPLRLHFAGGLQTPVLWGFGLKV